MSLSTVELSALFLPQTYLRFTPYISGSQKTVFCPANVWKWLCLDYQDKPISFKTVNKLADKYSHARYPSVTTSWRTDLFCLVACGIF